MKICPYSSLTPLCFRNLLIVIAWVLGVSVPIAATIVILVSAYQNKQPVARNKPLTYWLKQYGMHYQHEDAAKKEAEDAVLEIGTNAVPFLITMLERHDSRLKTRLIHAGARLHLIDLEVSDAAKWNLYGSFGFEILKAHSKDAVPALVQVVNENISESSRNEAIEALSVIGADAKQAVPCLTQLIVSSNSSRLPAIMALRSIHGPAESVVPAIVTCLQDPALDFPTKYRAIDTLGSYGSDAEKSVPLLRSMLSDPDTRVQAAAGTALTRIAGK